MKKYIKPSIEVTEIKTPTLAANSITMYSDPVGDETSNFQLGSKRTWGNYWDDEIEEE